jgi:hypothetical protein
VAAFTLVLCIVSICLYVVATTEELGCGTDTECGCIDDCLDSGGITT